MTTTTTGAMDADDFGLFSPEWMLKNSLAHVSHGMLYRGTMALVEYLTTNEELDTASALDVLTQVSLTGKYVPTEFKGGTTLVGYLPYDEDADPPITEDEIQGFIADVDNWGPTAKDPFDGWNLK